MTKTMINTFTPVFETFDRWDIWSEWWENMTWPNFTISAKFHNPRILGIPGVRAVSQFFFYNRSTSTWQLLRTRELRKSRQRVWVSRGSRLRSWRQARPPWPPPRTPPAACPAWAGRTWRAPAPKLWCLEHQLLPPRSGNPISRWHIFITKYIMTSLTRKGAGSEQWWGAEREKTRFCVKTEKEDQICVQEQKQFKEDEGRCSN